jgi:glutamine cyclotransferase
MSRREAEVEREYGPFPEVSHIRGVSYDGERVWFADGQKLHAFDPESGEVTRELEVPCNAGTAFDGKHLYQIAGDRILKLDPKTGQILHSIPAPHERLSGLAWAEGSLYCGRGPERQILELDPSTGKVRRTIPSNRFVTGVSFTNGELWHGTLENDESELRRIDPATGEVLEAVVMPKGLAIHGLESDGKDCFYCGGGESGKVRAVKRPKR